MRINVLKGSAVLAVAIAGAGCGGGSAKPQASAVPPLGPVAVISSADQITRPIDAYEVTVDQTTTLLRAASAVTAQCMQNFGLAFTAAASGKGFNDSAKQVKTRSTVYGFFNPDVVGSKGYDTVNVIDVGNGAEVPLSDAAFSVLNGEDRATGKPVTTYANKPLPEHGCFGKGAATAGSVPMPSAPGSLPDGGPQVPETDPRMVAVNAKWSDCMKSKGFSYATPWAAYFDPKWQQAKPPVPGGGPPAHSPDEIATATADMACKQSTNLVGIAVTVEGAYDKQYIESHATALAAFKQHLDDQLKRAAQIIAAGGTGTG